MLWQLDSQGAVSISEIYDAIKYENIMFIQLIVDVNK